MLSLPTPLWPTSPTCASRTTPSNCTPPSACHPRSATPLGAVVFPPSSARTPTTRTSSKMKLRILSQNANGLQQKGHFAKFLQVLSEWCRKGEFQVALIQEHNFDPSTLKDRIRLAQIKGFHAVISCAPPKIKQDGSEHYPGGTMILIYEKEVTYISTNRV